MKILLIIATMVFGVAGCGQRSQSHLNQLDMRQDPLDIGMQWWESNAPRCEGFPAKENCDDGDAVIFNGLLCGAGDERGCETVRNAQSPTGQWFRSPRRVEGNLGERHSFSRDQTMGVLLYLVQSKDRAAAERWMNWIENHRACEIASPFGGCAVWALPRVCTDDDQMSCTITPGLWSLVSRVWKYLELPLNQWMRTNDNLDYELHPVEANTSPLGYATHLNGVHNFLKLLLNVASGSRQRAAEILVQRQPENPFFRWLRDGQSATLKTRILDLCPKPNTPQDHWNQWSWERETAEQAWGASMGWDCLFMAKLLQKS